MPPGAKKKHKAAKRKKKQERREHLGSPQSGSPDCPSADHPRHLQEGNGERDDDVDLTSQENKGCESVSKLDLHAAGENGPHRLEVEAGEEQAESSVEDKGNKKEGQTSVAVHFASVMEGTNNGALDQTISESVAPQKADFVISNEVETEVPAAPAGGLKDDASVSSISASVPTISSEVPISKVEEDNEHIQSKNKLGTDVPAAQAGGLKDDVSLSSISDSAPAISSEIPISMIEEGTEHIQSERDKEVAVHEGHKESSSLEIPGPDDPVPVSAWVLQPSAVSIETVEVIERAAEASTEDQVNLVPPTNTTNQQQDPDGAGCDEESSEIAGTTEVARPTHLQQRTSWMNCCGIFDVITGDTR